MALNVFFDETTAEGILALLTIESDDNDPLYVVANNEAIVSRGRTYEPYPFSITLPLDSGDERPSASLQIANVTPEIMTEVRRFITAPIVKIELVLMSSPSTVEKTIDFLRMVNVEYDALSITATLEPVDLWSQPAVEPIYSPIEFPGLRSA